MDHLNLWSPIGALTAPDEKNGLQENDLVCIITSVTASSTHRMLDHLGNELGPFEDQRYRLLELTNCINDPNSTDYVILTQSGRAAQIARELIRPVEPEEFEAIVWSFFEDISNDNLDSLLEFLTFFGFSTTPYIDSIFSAVHSGITEAITRLQTAPFLQKERERNIIGLVLQAFYSLLNHRSNAVLVDGTTGFRNLSYSNPSALQDQRMPSFAFSEAALSIFHRLVQRIKDEQDSNPFLYFDKYALLKHSTLFQKLEDLHKTLFDVAIENSFRIAAVQKVYTVLEQFQSDSIREPFFISNRSVDCEVFIISFVQAIINAPANLFDSYVNAFCFFLCLEPSLMVALEDEHFREKVIPILNNTLKEKGSNDTFATCLASHSVPFKLKEYYSFKMKTHKCFFYKEKMFCSLTCRKFLHLTDSPELQKTVVLAPPAEFDIKLYSQVKPDTRIVVRSIQLELETHQEEPVTFDICCHKFYEQNQLDSFPRGFLRTWQTNDKILKEYLLTLMEEEEAHLAKFVTELIHDSEPNAVVFFQIILETNKLQSRKLFENIWQTGVCWYLLIACLEKCKGVRNLFPQHAEKIHKKFGEATTSMMSFGTLRYYYHRLKIYFNEKQQLFIERKLQERAEAEKCFSWYINAITDYTMDGKFLKFAKTHGYVFFTSFIYRFMNLALTKNDIHLLEKDLVIFRDTAFQISILRLRFADMNCKRQMGTLVRSTRQELPREHIDHIFNYTWAKLHATDMIGRTMLEQFEKSSLELIQRLGRGGQAEVYLARATNYPFEVVAKIAMDLESFYEISGELDSLMRTQSHPHVLHIYGYVVEFGDHIGIVMEYCKGGTVQDVIDDPKEVVDERRSLHWAIQAASGLLFLHQHDIIHRDVKPDNMLLDVAKSHLKISDLGLSKIVTEKKAPNIYKLQTSVRSYEDELKAKILGVPQSAIKIGMTSECGTEGYRAPEVFSLAYSSAIDVFSLGRSLWALIYRKRPDALLVAATWGVSSSSDKEAHLSAFTPSDELRSIAGRMMNENMSFRPTMKEAYDDLHRLYTQDMQKM